MYIQDLIMVVCRIGLHSMQKNRHKGQENRDADDAEEEKFQEEDFRRR